MAPLCHRQPSSYARHPVACTYLSRHSVGKSLQTLPDNEGSWVGLKSPIAWPLLGFLTFENLPLDNLNLDLACLSQLACLAIVHLSVFTSDRP